MVLINFWLWHEFHKHRLSYRMCSYYNAEEGNVFVWGYGILGKGPNLTETAEPEMIPPSLFGWSDFSPDTRVAHVRCGLSQFAALTSKFLILLSRRGHVAVLWAEEEKSKKKKRINKPNQNQNKFKTNNPKTTNPIPQKMHPSWNWRHTGMQQQGARQHSYRCQHGSWHMFCAKFCFNWESVICLNTKNFSHTQNPDDFFIFHIEWVSLLHFSSLEN